MDRCHKGGAARRRERHAKEAEKANSSGKARGGGRGGVPQ